MQKVFPLFESKGIYDTILLNYAHLCSFPGIARKCVHAQLPFHTGSDMPNSTTRSGSFGTRRLDPAPVRDPFLCI